MPPTGSSLLRLADLGAVLETKGDLREARALLDKAVDLALRSWLCPRARL